MNTAFLRSVDKEMDDVRVLFPRGDIYDRNGKLLATSSISYLVRVYPKYVKTSPQHVANILSTELQIPFDELYYKLRQNRSFLIKRRLSSEEVKNIKNLLKDDLQCVSFEEEYVRIYPFYPLLWHVLGVVSKVAEEYQGIAGVEASLNSILSGEPCDFTLPLTWEYKGRKNNSLSCSDVYLTIDLEIQKIVEEELERGMQKFSPKRGAVIVQDVATGEILGFACRPIYEEEEWRKNPKLLNNLAISEPFEPGSVFKSIVLAMALEEKVVSVEERIFCENGAWKPFPEEDVVIHDHEPLGFSTVADIVKFSSNIGFAKIIKRIPPKVVYRYINLFGFGNYTGIELPAESKGLIKPFSLLKPTEILYIGFGHGIGVTAIQIIAAYSALANNGRLMVPYIVKEVRNKKKEIIYENNPYFLRVTCSLETCEQVKKMLEGVVVNGTGKRAAVKGYRVGGKTGTAEKYIPGTKRYSKDKYISTFCGFFPLSSPKICVFVLFDEPSGREYYGGETAAPVFSRVASRIAEYLGIPPDNIEVTNRDSILKTRS
jgi:cell division protein FtsI/penicillin-binding protein 2